mgnify:CR=1 FL=1
MLFAVPAKIALRFDSPFSSLILLFTPAPIILSAVPPPDWPLLPTPEPEIKLPHPPTIDEFVANSCIVLL